MTSTPPIWQTRELATLVDILDSRRIPVSATERAARSGGIPYFGATGQVGWIDRPIFDEPLLLLGEDGVQFFDPSKHKAYRISGPTWVNNHAHVLRARASVDWRFLEHYLNWFDYRGFANGTTRLKLTQAAMCRIPVALPEFDEQLQIVNVLEDHLSRLDAADAGLTVATARLESLRIARWRTRFGRLSELWPVRPLYEVVRIENGQTPRGLAALLSVEPGADRVPYYKVGDMNAGDGRTMSDARFFVERSAAASLGLHVRPGGCVLIPKRGGAIHTNKKRLLASEAAYDLNTMGLRPTAELRSRYVWHWLDGIDLGAIADGSNVPQINAPQIRRLSIPVPTIEVQEAICDELDTFLTQRRAIGEEVARSSNRAATLRRALLTAAFSGTLTGRSSDLDRAEEMASI